MFGACFCSSALFLAANVCMITDKDREKKYVGKKRESAHTYSERHISFESIIVCVF